MRDDDGFAEYVERHGRHLVQVAYLVGGDLPQARAVVERVLSRGWLEWGRLSELPDPDTYFLRAVVASRSLRQGGPGSGGPLERLSRDQRVPVVLRHFEGLPNGRMAGVMDTSQAEAGARLDAALAALGPAGDLGSPLRAEAEAVPTESLLPAVRAGAQRRRVLRTGGLSAVALVVVLVVAGVAYLALTSSERRPAGAAKRTLDPADLTGHTWYLASWTDSKGAVLRPTTPVSPTLVFATRTSAVTADPVTTRWIFRLQKGTAFGVEDTRDAEARTAPEEAVADVVSMVLNGESTWQITGSTLVFRKGVALLTYTSDPSAAQHG